MVEPSRSPDDGEFPRDASEAKHRRHAQAGESGRDKEEPGTEEHEAGGAGLSG